MKTLLVASAMLALTAAENPPASTLRLSAHPNPFNPKTNLRFALAEPGAYRVSIHDVSGRSVQGFTGSAAAGERSLVWNAEGLPSGVFLARLSAAGGAAAERLILVK